ncbi:MAG: hypothetical protein KA807_12025 [Prolixibacteraceae bacterium]|nr:hypothetical protein [Prolixibacteraceae bacterium]
MKKFPLLFISFAIIGCIGKTQKPTLDQDTKDPISIIKENEQKSLEKQYDNLGELLYTISFQVKTEDITNFENGIIPWASIENPQEDLPNLINKDEIVIKETSVKIIIDYPLTTPYEFSLESSKGFTRALLLSEISKHYYKIYNEEEESATIKTIPINERTTMYNRNQTNGKYGIWGHDIADLDLSEISVYRVSNGQIILSLFVES